MERMTEQTLANHPETGPVSGDLLIEQVGRFRELLRAAGVTLLMPETELEAWCQVFTRDPSFVISNTLFQGQMRDAHRRPETEGLRKLSSQFSRFVELNVGFIEGGDIIVLSDGIVLVGTGEITNGAGYLELRQHLKRIGIGEIVLVPHVGLHLDCCIAPLPNRKCLFSEERFPPLSRELVSKYFDELIPLDEEDDRLHLAANILWLNPKTVVSTTNSPTTNQLLRAMGFEVHEIDFSQPIHVWGSVRCTVCPLQRDSG